MGKCKYCNKDCGFLRKKHKECHSKYLEEQEKERVEKIEKEKNGHR